MTTNKHVLSVARSYLGQGGAVFRKYCGLGAGQPYCNAYVDYVAYKGGVSSLYWNGKKITYCPTSYAWCKKNLARVPLYLAMAMDVIYLDWDRNGVPNHIGYVVCRKSTSTIRTIEGNTSGGIVDEKNRAGSYVLGVFRPHYKGSFRIGVLEIDGAFEYSSIANLERALGLAPTGVLSKSLVKKLQAKAGAKADGDWGKETSKKVQRLVGAKQDGDFGKESVKKLQQWINQQNLKESKPVEPTVPTDEKKKYQGTFPALPPKTAKFAVKCAYRYGTPLKKYRYSTGKAKPQYKTCLNKAYPSRSHWKYAKSRAGASCDVFAGTVLKRSGYKSAPHTMSTMVAWCRKHLKKVSTAKNGDILTRTNHVMVFLELRGKKRVANAHFLDHGGTYGIIEKVGQHTDIWRPDCPSYFSYGDEFTDMKYLKRFLNWYGGYGLRGYTFGDKTREAVKDFQAKEGLTVDGKFGAESLKAAKAVTK